MGIVARACNPNSENVDAGRPLGLSSQSAKAVWQATGLWENLPPPWRVDGKHMSTHREKCSQLLSFTCVLVICKHCVLISAVLHRSAFVCAESQPSYCLGNECLSLLSPNKEISMNQRAKHQGCNAALLSDSSFLSYFPRVHIPACSQLFCCNPFMDTLFQSAWKPRTRR